MDCIRMEVFMRKITVGISFGIVAGIIDVAPMLIMGLPWNANASAFSLWVVAGLMIAVSDLRLNGIIKGIVISYILAAPTMIIVFAANMNDAPPMLIMTLFLGGLLGYSIEKANSK